MSERATGAMTRPAGSHRSDSLPRIRWTAVAAVLGASAIVLWQALAAANSSSPAAPHPVQARTPAKTTTVTASSEQQLFRLVRAIPTPVYWSGPQRDGGYALTRTPQGWMYVSYLAPGASAPRDIHQYPFVATYPLAGAYAATLAAAQKAGSVRIPAPGGAVAFFYRAYPTSAYLAFRGSNYQVELFYPSVRRVRALIGSGKVHAIPAGHP